MEYQNDKWLVLPLQYGNVTELVLPEKNVAHLRKISSYNKETAGLLYGVIKGPSIYFMGSTVLGEGDLTSCSWNSQYMEFHNSFIERAIRAQPNLITIPYHNHPRIPPNRYSPEALDFVQRESESGIFDYLRDYGISPSLEEALAENSRYLSEADVNTTVGIAHVLITDTARKGEDFSHINAYKLSEDFLPGAVFRVVPLSSKSLEEMAWAGGVCSALKKVYDRLRSDFEAGDKK